MTFDSIKYFIRYFPAILKSIDADSNEETILDKLQSQFYSLQAEDVSIWLNQLEEWILNG